MIVSILFVGVAALIAAYAYTLWGDADRRTDAQDHRQGPARRPGPD
jgi:hypothetical protein